jgi:predicted pyridoxine 5'-phosphate oxidase superfamily flavin-nucleotide-binding protein
MADTAIMSEKQQAFIEAQEMFFVATAPLAADGTVNLSPKGLGDTFVVLDASTVAWLDLYGSGIETTAHILENGRVCLMFCAFEGTPNILRLQGRGEVLAPGDDAYASLLTRFPPLPGARSIIRVHLERVADSCGFGVPLYEFRGQRTKLPDSAANLGEHRLCDFINAKNATSIDGLPGVSR